MESVFRPGDIVLFQISENCFKSNIGIILKVKENGNYVVLSENKCAYKNIECSWIADVNDAKCIRNEIRDYCESKIARLQGQIRKPTQEEKDTEKIKKYEKLKQQIIATAKNLINCKDDCDFENKLKAITDMEKKIFSIKLDCASDIRKENGKIKYEIRQTEAMRDRLLKEISEEHIIKSFEWISD